MSSAHIVLARLLIATTTVPELQFLSSWPCCEVISDRWYALLHEQYNCDVPSKVLLISYQCPTHKINAITQEDLGKWPYKGQKGHG